MAPQFKIGYRVKRVIGEHCGMKVGDEATIIAINLTNSAVKLQEFNDGQNIWHSACNLEWLENRNFWSISSYGENPRYMPVPLNSGIAVTCDEIKPGGIMSYCTGEIIKIKPKTIMKTISNMMKKLLDSDTQTLVKAGYINGDLELTCEGKDALTLINFMEKKVELVDMANAKLAEEKDK